MSGAQTDLQRTKLHAVLHTLSQPLTVMSLALTVAQTSSSEADRAYAVEAALAECQRAMNSVHELRALVDQGVGPVPLANGKPLAVETEAHWKFGGAA